MYEIMKRLKKISISIYLTCFLIICLYAEHNAHAIKELPNPSECSHHILYPKTFRIRPIKLENVALSTLIFQIEGRAPKDHRAKDQPTKLS